MVALQIERRESVIFMKNEWEKCMAGEWYDCHAPIFLGFKSKARRLLAAYNALPYDQKEQKRKILEEMLGGIGSNVSIGSSFTCDYGCNIYLGNNVSINMNCTFVDCNRIEIGNPFAWRKNWKRERDRSGKRRHKGYSGKLRRGRQSLPRDPQDQ